MTMLSQWAEVLTRGVDLAWEIHQLGDHGDVERHITRLLPVSPQEAGRLRRLAAQLFGPAPRELHAFRRTTVEVARRERIDINRLLVINVAAGKIPHRYRHIREKLFRRMVERAHEHSLKELKTWGNRLVAEMHPDQEERRRRAEHKRALRNSRSADADGLLHLMARGPADRMARLISIIEDGARQLWTKDGDIRFEQAKFDALERLVLGHACHSAQAPNPLTSLRYQPAVVISAPELRQDSLIEDTERRQWIATTDGTMLSLSDYVSLTLADEGWAAVVGADHNVLSLHRIRRTFTPAQKAAQAIMQVTCAAPDCDRPATNCEGHHVTPWAQGGTTSMENLALLCPACHAKVGTSPDSKNDRLHKADDGHLEWISPDGSRYRSRLPIESINGISLALKSA